MSEQTNEQISKRLVAIESSLEIVKKLLILDCDFLVSHRNETITITGRKDVHTIKHHFPVFDLKQNKHQEFYAELILDYGK